MTKELWSANDVAAALSVSARHVWKLLAYGKLPRPVRLGRSVRRRRAELEQWLADGCPPRDRWEARMAVTA